MEIDIYKSHNISVCVQMYTRALVQISCTVEMKISGAIRCVTTKHRHNPIIAYYVVLCVSPLFVRAQETVVVDPSMYAQDASHIM